jgi:hypothetical protein
LHFGGLGLQTGFGLHTGLGLHTGFGLHSAGFGLHSAGLLQSESKTLLSACGAEVFVTSPSAKTQFKLKNDKGISTLLIFFKFIINSLHGINSFPISLSNEYFIY